MKNEASSARQVLDQYKDLINRQNFDLVRPLISKDCKFWFTSGTYIGLDETQKAFEKTWNMIKEEVYTLSDIEWLAESEKAAICTYTYHWKGLINGQMAEGKGRGTSCFRKEAGDWKIIHEHLSHFPK